MPPSFSNPAREWIIEVSSASAGVMGGRMPGIRAAIIDKDRNPNWRHGSFEDVTTIEVSSILMPLGENALNLQGEEA